MTDYSGFPVVNVTAVADGKKIDEMKITVAAQSSFQMGFNCTFLFITVLLGQIPANLGVTNTSVHLEPHFSALAQIHLYLCG